MGGFGGVSVVPRGEKPPAGWKPLAGHSQDVALIQLQESLDDYIGGLNASCLDGTAATALADAKLARFGFSGWTVTVRSASSGTGARTCVASDVVEPAKQTVTLIPSGESGSATARELADKLRPLSQSCESLPTTVRSVRAAAGSLGLSESARTYDLNAVADDSLRCAAVYETVGGTIFLTVRGPNR